MFRKLSFTFSSLFFFFLKAYDENFFIIIMIRNYIKSFLSNCCSWHNEKSLNQPTTFKSFLILNQSRRNNLTLREVLIRNKKCEFSQLGGGSSQKFDIFTFFLACSNSSKSAIKFFCKGGRGTPWPIYLKI